MKKFQKMLLATTAMLMINYAGALEIVDVKSDYWAGREIVHSIQNEYIYVINGNRFMPEGTMSRAEFVTALLKVIRKDNEKVAQNTVFKDIEKTTPDFKNIVISEKIRMAFGYPDKTFKPERAINHNEAMSMIANITKDDYSVADITDFEDWEQIPLWATRAYIKNVANNLYVNHPDKAKFTPSTNLTRAEAAVLFDKVAQNLDKVQEEYREMYNQLSEDNNWGDAVPSEHIAENTLSIADFAENNKVQVYDNKKVIEAGNILIATDVDHVTSREDAVGESYIFTAPEDVYTVQGTFVFPKGTEFYARDEKKGYSAWRAKPERSNVVFYKYVLPSGTGYDMAGVPFTKDDNIVYVGTVKKAQEVKTAAKADNQDKQYLIDTAHQMSPKLDYKLKENTIYILVTGDLVIPQNDEYLNLRTKKSVLEEKI